MLVLVLVWLLVWILLRVLVYSKSTRVFLDLSHRSVGENQYGRAKRRVAPSESRDDAPAAFAHFAFGLSLSAPLTLSSHITLTICVRLRRSLVSLSLPLPVPSLSALPTLRLWQHSTRKLLSSLLTRWIVVIVSLLAVVPSLHPAFTASAIDTAAVHLDTDCPLNPTRTITAGTTRTVTHGHTTTRGHNPSVNRPMTEPRSSTTTTATAAGSPSLATLAMQYASLRTQPSHFGSGEGGEGGGDASGGGQWNDQVDPFQSPKHQVMDQLRLLLGQPGASIERVMENMGEPDEITSDLDNPFQSPSFMPGPVLGDTTTTSTTSTTTTGEQPSPLQPGESYLCYYWRGRHDFLWFRLAQGDAEVHSSGWHNALE